MGKKTKKTAHGTPSCEKRGPREVCEKSQSGGTIASAWPLQPECRKRKRGTKGTGKDIKETKKIWCSKKL